MGEPTFNHNSLLLLRVLCELCGKRFSRMANGRVTKMVAEFVVKQAVSLQNQGSSATHIILGHDSVETVNKKWWEFWRQLGFKSKTLLPGRDRCWGKRPVSRSFYQVRESGCIPFSF